MPNSSALKASVAVPPPSSPTQVIDELEIYWSDSACTVAVAGRYVLMIVREATTNSSLSAVRRAMSALYDRYPMFGFLVILESGCQLLLPPDVRKGMASTLKRHGDRCAGAAVVYERTGFHATAVRSIVTAVNLASRASHPTRVCAELRDGVSWLNQLTGGTPSATRLLWIAKQLRIAV